MRFFEAFVLDNFVFLCSLINHNFPILLKQKWKTSCDSSNGDVSTASLLQHVMPNLHPSTYRAAIRKATDTTGITVRYVKMDGKDMSVLSIEDCVTILPRMTLTGWQDWWTKNGSSFLQDLRQHVTNKMNMETKTSALEKSLRDANIEGSIRVDEKTGLGSILDVIKLITPEKNKYYIYKAFSNLIAKDESLSDKIQYIKINDKGNLTPVGDANTIVGIIWSLQEKLLTISRERLQT